MSETWDEIYLRRYRELTKKDSVPPTVDRRAATLSLTWLDEHYEPAVRKPEPPTLLEAAKRVCEAWSDGTKDYLEAINGLHSAVEREEAKGIKNHRKKP